MTAAEAIQKVWANVDGEPFHRALKILAILIDEANEDESAKGRYEANVLQRAYNTIVVMKPSVIAHLAMSGQREE